jgi:hypothetical protein
MLLPKYESRRIMAEALDKATKDEIDAIGHIENPLERLKVFINALGKSLKEKNRRIKFDNASIRDLKNKSPFKGDEILVLCDDMEYPIKWKVDPNNKSLIFNIGDLNYRVGNAFDAKAKKDMVKSTWNQIKNITDIIAYTFAKEAERKANMNDEK